MPSFEIPTDIFIILKVFDKSPGESNTERQVKLSADISKNLKIKGEGEFKRVLIKLMNQNLSKGKNLHESS